jgi:hypothetical protein
MMRPETTGRKISTDDNTAIDAYSIAEFCRRHRFSVSTFYKMRAQGEAPDLMFVGDRVLIAREAAARWRKHRTRKATT